MAEGLLINLHHHLRARSFNLPREVDRQGDRPNRGLVTVGFNAVSVGDGRSQATDQSHPYQH